jgi:hypothetical protein
MVNSAVGWLCPSCGHVSTDKPAKAVKKPAAAAVVQPEAAAHVPVKRKKTLKPASQAKPPQPATKITPAPESSLPTPGTVAIPSDYTPPVPPPPAEPSVKVWHNHHNRRRALIALVILAALAAAFYFGYLAPARAAWASYQQRLSTAPNAAFSGRLIFTGQQFLSAMNSDINFEGQYDRLNPANLQTALRYNGTWANQAYSGEAVTANSSLYFKTTGNTQPVIRFQQSNFTYPLTTGWHKTAIGNSLYSNYCEVREADFKAPTGVFWLQLSRSLKVKTSPLANPYARIDNRPVVHYRGSVDPDSFRKALDQLNAALPPSCGLAISGSDLAKLKINYDFYAGKGVDRWVVRLQDESLGAGLTLTLQTGLYGQAPGVTVPADAVDLDAMRISQQQLLNRDQTRKADIDSLKSALTAYYQANRQRYPTRLNMVVPRYAPKLPTDPKTGSQYSYSTANSRRNFSLTATLEEPGAGAYTVTGP